MKQSVDAVLIAAVAVVTMLGAVAMMSGKSGNNPVDSFVSAKWNQWTKQTTVTSFSSSGGSSAHHSARILHGHQPAVIEPSMRTDVSSQTRATSKTAPSGTGHKTTINQNHPPTGHWTKKDVARLEAIGTHLVFALQPEDWQLIAQALSTGESRSTSDQTLAQILRDHLSSADRKWLVAHFTGEHAVNQEDVALLQRSVSQAESELTPAERQLLEQGLNSMEGKSSQATHHRTQTNHGTASNSSSAAK